MALIGVRAIDGWAAAPVIYRQPDFESPVRGEPDDLLFIAGYGFGVDDKVVYQSIDGARPELHHPSEIPEHSSATLGIADIVSGSNVPFSLTVRLPKIIREKQAYALWVMTKSREWSAPVRINDARPLWISPSFVYSTASIGSVGRYIKVVGRNLEPALDGITEIRLSGPENLMLKAKPSAAETAALDRYVALADLPAS